MATEFSVVVSAVGANTEQVREGVTKLPVPRGEWMLIQLLREDNLQVAMPESAIQVCRNQFSMDRMIARMKEYDAQLITA